VAAGRCRDQDAHQTVSGLFHQLRRSRTASWRERRFTYAVVEDHVDAARQYEGSLEIVGVLYFRLEIACSGKGPNPARSSPTFD